MAQSVQCWPSLRLNLQLCIKPGVVTPAILALRRWRLESWKFKVIQGHPGLQETLSQNLNAGKVCKSKFYIM